MEINLACSGEMATVPKIMAAAVCGFIKNLKMVFFVVCG